VFLKIENSKQLTEKDARDLSQDEKDEIRRMAKYAGSSGESYLHTVSIAGKSFNISDGREIPRLVGTDVTGGFLRVKEINAYIQKWIDKNKNYGASDRGLRIQGAEKFRRVIRKLKTGSSARQHLYNTNKNGEKIIAKLNEFIKKAKAVQNPPKEESKEEEPKVENTKFDTWNEAVDAMTARGGLFQNLQVDGVSYVYEGVAAPSVLQYTISPGADMEAASMGYISASFANEQAVDLMSRPDEAEEEEAPETTKDAKRYEFSKSRGRDVMTIASWSDFEAAHDDFKVKVGNHTPRIVKVQSSGGKPSDYTKLYMPKGVAYTKRGTYVYRDKVKSNDGDKDGAYRKVGSSGSRKERVYGTSERWRPRGAGGAKREQYIQFYKDLKTAGLLGKLFKGGKIRDDDRRGSVKTADFLNESDGLDFAWGSKHTEAYKALLAKVKESGHKSVEDWRKAGGKAVGATPTQEPESSAEEAVPASKIAAWNERRASMFRLPPLEGERLKRVIQAVKQGQQGLGGKPLFNQELGLTGAEEAKLVRDGKITANQVKTAMGMQAAGVDVPGGGPGARRSATARGRKVAGSMIAKDVRELQANIDTWGSEANAKLKSIITKYARGGEHEGTGVPRTLTQLYTRYQKFANVNLIKALQDDGQDELVKIVRYGLQGVGSGEGDSKGVLRRGGQDKQYDADLEDDAERLIRMGPADNWGTDEDGIEAVLNKNARNLVALAKAYRQMAKDDSRVGENAKTLIDMIEDEMGQDRGLARDVQTQIQRQAQTVRESKMSKLSKLRKLFKEEYAKKLAEQTTTGGMTLPSGKDIGAMSIDPADLEQMLDEPHPSTQEEPSAGASRGGLTYSGPQKAFIRYIKGLRKKGKLSRTQEKKLRRAVFSKKYKPRDTRGAEITKLINSEVVTKMNLDQRANKPIAGVEKALSGQRASLDDLKSSLKRLQKGPQNARTKRSIARVQRMIARAEQRGPDLDIRQMAQNVKADPKASLSQLKASLKNLESGPQNPATKRAAERVKRMIARAVAPKSAPEVDVMQVAQKAGDLAAQAGGEKSKTEQIELAKKMLASARDKLLKDTTEENMEKFKRAQARLARLSGRSQPIQTATDLP
jgi:hypothetical protein